MDQQQQQQRPQQPQQRELVFCHQCENEWYRDEHGIICPECQSDFTEILEGNNDPRQEEGPPPLGGLHGLFASHPGERDDDDFSWRPNGPGQPPGAQLTGRFSRNINMNMGPNGPQGGAGGGGAAGIFGLLAPALQGLIGGQRRPPQGEERPEPAEGEHGEAGGPQGYREQRFGNGGTFVRHSEGPGYSFTISTTTNQPNLFPRNAYGPQPHQDQPDNINHMMAQMFANIGVMHGHGIGGGGGIHRGGPMFMEFGGGPHAQGGDPGMPNFAHLLQLLGGPPGGVHGDAVYSQEGLDRIISQLMEQHRSGNAPPPAAPEAIDSLPKRAISPKDLGDNDKADCSICMDEAALGSMVTELPCGHWFHHDCIKAWLGEHDTCPHCRQGITPKDASASEGRARDPSQAALHDIHRDHANEAGRDSAQQSGESSGGLFSRLRSTFSPSGSTQQNQNQQGGSGNGNASGRS